MERPSMTISTCSAVAMCSLSASARNRILHVAIYASCVVAINNFCCAYAAVSSKTFERCQGPSAMVEAQELAPPSPFPVRNSEPLTMLRRRLHVRT